MADETPIVQKPKKKRRGPKPKLSKQDAIATAAALLSLDERACVHLSMEYDEEKAASTLMWSLEAVREVLARKHVQAYIKSAEEKFLIELAKAKVRRLKKINATPAHVEARLMDLAMLDPEETRGNIDGQVKALTTLARILGMLSDDDPLKRKSPEELKKLVQQAHGRIIEASRPAETLAQ